MAEGDGAGAARMALEQARHQQAARCGGHGPQYRALERSRGPARIPRARPAMMVAVLGPVQDGDYDGAARPRSTRLLAIARRTGDDGHTGDGAAGPGRRRRRIGDHREALVPARPGDVAGDGTVGVAHPRRSAYWRHEPRSAGRSATGVGQRVDPGVHPLLRPRVDLRLLGGCAVSTRASRSPPRRSSTRPSTRVSEAADELPLVVKPARTGDRRCHRHGRPVRRR